MLRLIVVLVVVVVDGPGTVAICGAVCSSSERSVSYPEVTIFRSTVGVVTGDNTTGSSTVSGVAAVRVRSFGDWGERSERKTRRLRDVYRLNCIL